MQLLILFDLLHVGVGVTIIAATAVSFFFKPILRVRYLMPAVGVFWLAISILVGRTKQDKLLIVSLFLIMILGISGAFALLDFNNAAQATGISNQNVLNDMNQNNTTVICIGAGEVIQFGTYFNNSNVYMNTHNAYGIKEKNLTELFNIKHSPNLNKTIDKNSDRDIFL